MNVSAISQISSEDCKPRRNLFIQFANSFMSAPQVENPIEKAGNINPTDTIKKPVKMGIEQLEEFTIFPKEVVDGKMVITA